MLLDNCEIRPICNQIEVHPYWPRNDITQFCKEEDIVVVANCPSVSVSIRSSDMSFRLTRGKRLQDPKFEPLINKHNKTAAQLLIRWSLQQVLWNMVILPQQSL